MHLLRTDTRSLDDTVEAVDLAQTPADIVALSFSDADLAGLAAAWGASEGALPSLRLASLAALRHPYSVDLYVEKVAAGARFVLARLLGGLDYWRYGVEELSRAARERGFTLAIVPGDAMADPRLDAASTLPKADLARIHAFLQNGGQDNLANLLRFIAERLGRPTTWSEPGEVSAFDLIEAARREGRQDGARALILAYRSAYMTADIAPVTALADALAARGLGVTGAFVTSLKDAAVAGPLASLIGDLRPDVILNTTAFSARIEDGGAVLDKADCPVLQAILAGSSAAVWQGGARGLSTADLAMNVVLPEIDGRIIAGAISFKAQAPRSEALEFGRVIHAPEPSRIARVADLARAWARLRCLPAAKKRLALVLSDYPGKGGREGYAVGLDTPASVVAIADALRRAGYAVSELPAAAELMSALTRSLPDRSAPNDLSPPPSPSPPLTAFVGGGRRPALARRHDGPALGASLPPRSGGEGEGGGRFARSDSSPRCAEEREEAALALSEYRRLFAALPPDFQKQVTAAWGVPDTDPDVVDGAFRFRVLRAGNLIMALQPDRGRRDARKGDYHDTSLPPRHGYIAFYGWLREVEGIDAMIHGGTHGTLEWLPGKATALSESCAPEAVLGPLPVIYPFIVNNPGEAAQAKRRIGAVTVGHMTPPFIEAGAHGATAELEALFDEYANAQALDARRARLLARAILDKAAETDLASEAGLGDSENAEEALVRLDAWLCDIKEMRIGDGLHVFGQEPNEVRNLLRALDGRFVEPGPAGAPSRGRLDVLPTGRNLYTIDPRAVPTRTAWEIGSRTAAEVMTRHAQDHGEWPRRIVLDLWGSASMRTGGDDLAQAFALMGVRPRWDDASTRVNGFEILPLARLDWPRVDVTLRISGLFRDVFPAQIALFDEAARAVAALDEEDEDNPLAAAVRAAPPSERALAAARVFGAAPGAYGVGLSARLAADATVEREELGAAYLAATSHMFGAKGLADGMRADGAYAARVTEADAFVHVQDIAGQDVLDADAFAEHEAGFAAASAMLGGKAALYHADTTRPERSVVRTLPEEIARVVRGRAANPRWIAGQMRHGHRGAAEIAETVDNLYAFAAMSDAVTSAQFDMLYDATLGDERVRDFLVDANPAAARAIAARFAAATRRGWWTSRRNSTAAELAAILGEKA